jgi:hypothetical protein
LEKFFIFFVSGEWGMGNGEEGMGKREEGRGKR